MNTDIKQAMHVEAAKSFGTSEANENERRWNEDKVDCKNQDPTNNYDKTRMRLNFEIGPDGKIHPLGYQEKSLELRLQERLLELGWKPFKPDSKIQPNCCAKFVFGGNHERTLEMAFGNQTVNLEKGSDNSHLHRCEEIELWAKDVYDWCSRRYGQENIVGFQVHLDESSPHIHALVVPVGIRPKSGRECVMWSAKFGKNRFEYGQILKEMHTSLYEEVGSKYGLERGDSIYGRNVQHLNKRDYIRKLSKEAKQAEKAVKGLQTMIHRLESQIFKSKSQLEQIDKELASGKIALEEYKFQKADIQKQISEYQSKLEDKADKLHTKEQELTYYGVDLYKRQMLPQLIEKISEIPGVEWIRLHYAYPAHFPMDLFRVMRERPNVCKYMDIALQHISDNMLEKMRRHVTKEDTYRLIEKFREEVPGIHLRTTLMVGHPGETEADFEELKEFVRKVRFDRMGAFAYSEEEGTYAAAHYEDSIPQEVKQARLDELMSIQQGISAELSAAKVGRQMGMRLRLAVV